MVSAANWHKPKQQQPKDKVNFSIPESLLTSIEVHFQLFSCFDQNQYNSVSSQQKLVSLTPTLNFKTAS